MAAADGLGPWEPAPAGVAYTDILRTDDRQVLKSVGGVLTGLLAFLSLAGPVSQGLMWLFWTASGSPGEWTAWRRSAVAFESPLGMLAAHLGLATLIPISLGLLWLVHRRPPRWLGSVRPWFRWGYLAACAGVALVVFTVMLAASTAQAWTAPRPQPDFAVFLVVILLTSPLQAAAEEFFFRGYLMQALGSALRVPWLAVVVSAGVFSAFHGTQNLPLFLDRFAFGVLAGLLVLRTGGLEAAIAAHVVNNILAFTYAGLWSTIAQVKAVQQLGWAEAAWDVAAFAVFALLAWWLAARWGLATTTPVGEPGLSRGREVR